MGVRGRERGTVDARLRCEPGAVCRGSRGGGGVVVAQQHCLFLPDGVFRRGRRGRSAASGKGLFESETLVVGDKLGVLPHTIRVSLEGELFAVDATNNNIVRITPPLSQYSRARFGCRVI
ncbi:uncharacterized protein LOC122024691 [Zingiber officinale]|uniref:uncharacterized protein LOC122024691 n=1 Tax=Zingiber officinale TaxID=94328 RepID=UPI001C4B8CCB|nr:uncharacterized protein LOC122024691 [Zingiber officinale]